MQGENLPKVRVDDRPLSGSGRTARLMRIAQALVRTADEDLGGVRLRYGITHPEGATIAETLQRKGYSPNVLVEHGDVVPTLRLLGTDYPVRPQEVERVANMAARMRDQS